MAEPGAEGARQRLLFEGVGLGDAEVAVPVRLEGGLDGNGEGRRAAAKTECHRLSGMRRQRLGERPPTGDWHSGHALQDVPWAKRHARGLGAGLDGAHRHRHRDVRPDGMEAGE